MASRELPGLFHLGAVLRVGHQPIARQQVGQAPGFAAAHGIGLAGQGEGTCPFFADLAGEQMKIDQALHHGRSFSALVHPHRPQTQHLLAPVKQSRHVPQTFFGDVAEQGHPPGGPAGGHVEERVVVLGVVVDEGRILAVVPQHQVGDAMQQGQVAAGCNRQVNIGRFGGVGAAWVHHHDLDAAGVLAFPLQQPLEQHRVAFGGVGADQKGHRAVIQIVVAAGRAIGTQAAGVAGHR